MARQIRRNDSADGLQVFDGEHPVVEVTRVAMQQNDRITRPRSCHIDGTAADVQGFDLQGISGRFVGFGNYDGWLGAEEVFDFGRSEEHTSELQSLMRISYAVFCLKKNIPILIQYSHTHDEFIFSD